MKRRGHHISLPLRLALALMLLLAAAAVVPALNQAGPAQAAVAAQR